MNFLTYFPSVLHNGVYFASVYASNYLYPTGNLKNHKFKKYGWKRDLPDKRDLWFEHNYLLSVENSLTKVDLRDKCPQVYNQGQLGSCTANALACAIQYDEMKQNLNNQCPSRLFIYYNERDMEGNVDNDSGASLRDGVKCINTIG